MNKKPTKSPNPPDRIDCTSCGKEIDMKWIDLMPQGYLAQSRCGHCGHFQMAILGTQEFMSKTNQYLLEVFPQIQDYEYTVDFPRTPTYQ